MITIIGPNGNMDKNKEKKLRQQLQQRKQLANQANQARLNKAKAYSEEAPTPYNLARMFWNWFNGTKILNGQSQYITGDAPVGGKRHQLLNLQQLRNLQLNVLRNKSAREARNAVNRITEQDAVRQMIRERYPEEIEYRQNHNSYPEQTLDYEYDNGGFDPASELFEYFYGGTDTGYWMKQNSINPFR